MKHIWVVFLLFACKSPESNPSIDSTKKLSDVIITEDSNASALVAEEVSEHTMLEDSKIHRIVDFPYLDSIWYSTAEKKMKLTRADWVEFHYSQLEEYNKSFIYSVYGYLYDRNQLFVLIERSYSEESLHWICAVDENLNLIDHVMISEDNSEGGWGSKSKISLKQKLIVTVDLYEFDKKKTISYHYENMMFSKL